MHRGLLSKPPRSLLNAHTGGPRTPQIAQDPLEGGSVRPLEAHAITIMPMLTPMTNL